MRNIGQKAGWTILCLSVWATWAGAIPALADEKDDQIKALTERVNALEKKVADLERQLAKSGGSSGAASAGSAGAASAAKPADVNAIRVKARQRTQRDTSKYKPEQLREIEALYQPSNDRAQRGSEQVKAALEKLITTYPDSNRAGCAVLYLAQWADGDERVKLFTDAYTKHADAFYGDGCQVGPYARFQLGQFFLHEKQPEKAKEQFDALRKESPTAIDHNGQLLVAQIPAE